MTDKLNPEQRRMVYVDIALEDGGRYVQPIDQIGVLVDEIKEAAACGSLEAKWTVKLREMSPAEYEQLPEFEGH